MPVPAVMNGGMPTVSSGSAITTFGIISGWKMIFLVCVASSVMTPARPTSEPVPAVVGTATIGAMPSASARVHQSPISSKSHIGRVCPAMKAMSLPVSSAEPPPKATTPSCPPARRRRCRASRFASTGFGFTSEKSRASSPPSRRMSSARSRDRQLGEPRIGDEQRLRDPRGLAGLRQLGDAARAEADGGGIVPVGDERWSCSDRLADDKISAASACR